MTTSITLERLQYFNDATVALVFPQEPQRTGAPTNDQVQLTAWHVRGRLPYNRPLEIHSFSGRSHSVVLNGTHLAASFSTID